MTTAVRRGVGAVLTALGLVLATTGLMTLVNPELEPPPRAVAPIDLQDPAGPDALPSPPAAEPTPDGPAVVAGPDTPSRTTDDADAGQAPPAPSTSSSSDTVEASGARDDVGAVAIEAPEPLPAGDTRTTAAVPADDPAATTTVDTDPPASAPVEPDEQDDPAEQDDPNEVATRDDQDDRDGADDEDADDADDEPGTRPRAHGGGAGGAVEASTPTRATARAPDLDTGRRGKGPAVDVPGVARGLADAATGHEDRPGRGHGRPWVMRGR